MLDTWKPVSWRDRPAAQQPDWPDQAALESALATISGFPPLVFAGEARALTTALGHAAEGRAFLIQAGDCAESFDVFAAPKIREQLRVILQMSVVLTYSSGVPAIKVGRIAGQFAKPRSAPTERVGDVELPVFRGHIVNGAAPTPEARRPDPARLIQAYHQSASTLNLLRAYTKGGFADLSRVHAWNQEFVATSREGQRYEALAEEIERALRFMRACGIDLEATHQLHQVDLYTSHEALILGYEEALTRRRLDHRRVVRLLGAHALDRRAHAPDRRRPHGVPARRRQPARREARADRHHGRGARAVRDAQPGARAGPADADLPDGRRPRRGPPAAAARRRPRRRAPGAVGVRSDARATRYVTSAGTKTRHLDDIVARDRRLLPRPPAEGTQPGGIHVELTGDDVTECLGGAEEILDEHLTERYETVLDPRLNGRQSIDLAFRVAELLRDGS